MVGATVVTVPGRNVCWVTTPVALLNGAWQVGKSTLARQLIGSVVAST